VANDGCGRNASRIEYRHEVSNRLIQRIGFCFHWCKPSYVTTHVEGDGLKTSASYRFHQSLQLDQIAGKPWQKTIAGP
jgi:hypothetical protein